MTSPRLSKQCRAMLRGASREQAELREHVEACDFCRDWLQRRDRLTGLLSQPVVSPDELRSTVMLNGIRERIVDASENSPLGEALEQTMPVDATPDPEVWPATALEPELAARIRRVPAVAPEWSDVRESVLGGRRLRPIATRSGLVAATAVAAAAVLCALLLTENDRPASPEIVFADVSSLPGVEFSPMSVLRNGGQK